MLAAVAAALTTHVRYGISTRIIKFIRLLPLQKLLGLVDRLGSSHRHLFVFEQSSGSVSRCSHFLLLTHNGLVRIVLIEKLEKLAEVSLHASSLE